MQTTAPYGYGEIVPLRKDHRVRLAPPGFARGLNALALALGEFVAAARDYPIVFTSLDEGASFAPLIVLGLEPGMNLFVGATGEWEQGTYLPAFVRRYPFCISKLYVDGKAESDRVVCVARAQLDDKGELLFDTEGKPTARWQAAEQLLAEYEADLDRTAQMCAALARMQLFEPFSMQSAQASLTGMHRISEAKLRDLKPASHKLLVDKGFMGLIYAHLHSLENFRRLVDRQREAGRG